MHLADFPVAASDEWRDADARRALDAAARSARGGERGSSNWRAPRRPSAARSKRTSRLRVPASDPALADLLARHRDDLPMLFIVSSVDVVTGADALARRGRARRAARSARAAGGSSPRSCTDGDHAGLCLRCATRSEAWLLPPADDPAVRRDRRAHDARHGPGRDRVTARAAHLVAEPGGDRRGPDRESDRPRRHCRSTTARPSFPA